MAEKRDKPGADADGHPRDVLERDDHDDAEELDILQRGKADLREADAGEGRDRRLADVEEAIQQL